MVLVNDQHDGHRHAPGLRSNIAVAIVIKAVLGDVLGLGFAAWAARTTNAPWTWPTRTRTTRTWPAPVPVVTAAATSADKDTWEPVVTTRLGSQPAAPSPRAATAARPAAAPTTAATTPRTRYSVRPDVVEGRRPRPTVVAVAAADTTQAVAAPRPESATHPAVVAAVGRTSSVA